MADETAGRNDSSFGGLCRLQYIVCAVRAAVNDVHIDHRADLRKGQSDRMKGILLT